MYGRINASWQPLNLSSLTTNLTIAPPSPTQPSLTLNKASGVNAGTAIYGNYAGNTRWAIFLGDGGSEPGSNAGNNLSIYRYADNGQVIDPPLQINRQNGGVTFPSPGGVTISGSAVVAGKASSSAAS